MSFLPSKANSNVIGSIYSISVPIGIPVAILVTLTFLFSRSFFIYCIVVSPSIEGFKARIISFTLSPSIREINLLILISSGPIPSRGDIRPPRT